MAAIDNSNITMRPKASGVLQVTIWGLLSCLEKWAEDPNGQGSAESLCGKAFPRETTNHKMLSFKSHPLSVQAWMTGRVDF